MKQRSLHVDTLRGVACVLLVAFHVVGVDQNAGLKIDAGIYREINDLLAYVRMPLFTFLSGIVYAYRPVSKNARAFVRGKFRRLLIPMLTVGTLFAVVQAIIPGANYSVENWWLLHLVPVGHFWFVESLFLIFLVMIPLEHFSVLRSLDSFAVILLISVVVYVSSFRFHYFSVTGAVYLFPYFLLGVAVQRFSLLNFIGEKLGYLLLGMGSIALLVVSLRGFAIDGNRSLFEFGLGGVLCIALLSLRIESPSLAKIGGFSYSIYLYHVFFTAGTRIFLRNVLAVSDINILFVCSLSIGIIGPIATELFFRGANFTRVAFLGQSKADLHELWMSRLWRRSMDPLKPQGGPMKG